MLWIHHQVLGEVLLSLIALVLLLLLLWVGDGVRRVENGCSAGLGKWKEVMRETGRSIYTTESCMGKVMMPPLQKHAMCYRMLRMTNPQNENLSLSVCALFPHIPSDSLSIFNSFSEKRNQAWQLLFSMSIIPHLSSFPPIILYLNPLLPPSSLGKGLRCQPCACGWWLYLSLFAQKPELQKRE